MDGDIDSLAKPGEIFIHRIVQYLGNTMVQSPFVGAANVHSRFLADCLQPFQLPKLCGIVSAGNFRWGTSVFDYFESILVRHKIHFGRSPGRPFSERKSLRKPKPFHN
jgi:hypothetical protein